jgi:hypothetical protein
MQVLVGGRQGAQANMRLISAVLLSCKPDAQPGQKHRLLQNSSYLK